MKTTVLLTFLGLFISSTAFSQSDEDLIRHTIQNYFNGTAYSYLDQIESAFYAEATLYLENTKGEMLKLSPAEYIAFFKKNKPGSFGGRYSKILSIEQEGNLAQVSAEILVPSRNRRYLDVFITRRMDDGRWLIVSKAANSAPIKQE